MMQCRLVTVLDCNGSQKAFHTGLGEPIGCYYFLEALLAESREAHIGFSFHC